MATDQRGYTCDARSFFLRTDQESAQPAVQIQQHPKIKNDVHSTEALSGVSMSDYRTVGEITLDGKDIVVSGPAIYKEVFKKHT